MRNVSQQHPGSNSSCAPSSSPSTSAMSVAWLWSELWYTWLTPLLKVGAERPLTMTDVHKYPLPNESRVHNTSTRLESSWNYYQSVYSTVKHPKLLLYALINTFGLRYAFGIIPSAIDICCVVIRPILFSQLLQCFFVLSQSSQHSQFEHLHSMSALFPSTTAHAIFLILLILVSAWLRGLANFLQQFWNWRLSMEIRTALAALVFRKSLRVASVRRGTATNLLTTDAYTIGDFTWHGLRTIGFSVLITLILLMLGRWVGLAALTPLVLLFCFGPLTSYIWKQIGDAQDALMKLNDERIKSLAEILHAILVVKIMCWEEKMKERVNFIRKKELTHVKRLNMMQAANSVSFFSIAVLSSVFTFLSYVLMGNELSAAIVFPSLIYIMELDWPLLALPGSFKALQSVWISIRRVYHFLSQEEIAMQMLLQAPTEFDGEEVIQLKDASFAWYEEAKDLDDDLENSEQQKTQLQPSEVKDRQSRENDIDSEPDDDGEFVVDDENGEKGEKEAMLKPHTKNVSSKKKHGSHSSTSAVQQECDGAQSIGIPLRSIDFPRSCCVGSSALSNLNFSVRSGEFVMIIGRVGSFKSALLKSILGEMKLMSGQRRIHGKIAYVPQTAWIRSDTVEKNIKLFATQSHQEIAHHDANNTKTSGGFVGGVRGVSGFDNSFYHEVLSACCLVGDLQMFPQGDQTKIGEKGITISGGQRQRCALARAVYSRPSILLLDDALSAVDAHIGKSIFHNCLMGPLLKGTTKILVTHALQYLPYADRIIVMDQGKIIQNGTFQQIAQQHTHFTTCLKTEEEKQQEQNLDGDKLHESVSQLSFRADPARGDSESAESVISIYAAPETVSCTEDAHSREHSETSMIAEEEREIGAVQFSVYWSYLRSIGSRFFLTFVILASFIQHATLQSLSIWLAEWTNAMATLSQADNAHLQPFNSSISASKDSSALSSSISIWLSSSFGSSGYLLVYVLLAVLAILCLLVRHFTWWSGAFTGSMTFHENLLHAIVYAKMSFFYSTPSGRVTARFSRDMMNIDQTLPERLNNSWTCAVSIVMVVSVVVAVLPLMIPVVCCILVIYYKVAQFYACSVRELGRLDTLSSSPIFAHYSEVIDGLESIRAFHGESLLREESESLQDKNANVSFVRASADGWLSVRAELIASLVVFAISCVALVWSSILPPAFLALILTASDLMSGDLTWFAREAAIVEATMNSVERINEYTQTASEESSAAVSDGFPLAGWPSRGELVFHSVSLRYRPSLPLVLRNLSFRIFGREKIGIVGKTGAGKSSITNLLFRLVDMESDSRIEIDGRNIATVPLSRLRQSLALINQDPILFSGTIRSNLDPFHQYTDENIWNALTSVSLPLATKVRSYSNDLLHSVSDNGKNFSLGERQLFCLARILLCRNTRIVVLDEASSNIDEISDGIIQKTLLKAFYDKTVIIIAHRLHTIIHCDRVMLLENGQILEFDSPAKLLANEQSKFRQLVQQTGQQNAQSLYIKAQQAETQRQAQRQPT